MLYFSDLQGEMADLNGRLYCDWQGPDLATGNARDPAVAAEATLQESLQLTYGKEENLLRAYWLR